MPCPAGCANTSTKSVACECRRRNLPCRTLSPTRQSPPSALRPLDRGAPRPRLLWPSFDHKSWPAVRASSISVWYLTIKWGSERAVPEGTQKRQAFGTGRDWKEYTSRRAFVHQGRRWKEYKWGHLMGRGKGCLILGKDEQAILL